MPIRSSLLHAALAAILFGLPLSGLSAADWPQWRGPDRDGSVLGDSLPSDLPTALRRLWRVEVGIGHSSPVVVGERVYMLSREGSDEIIRALDLADGREIWRWGEETPYSRNIGALRHGKGPKSTLAATADSVCGLSINGRLTCVDSATGELRWRNDFKDRFARTWPDFGAATSPAIFGDVLIAYVGGIQEGALTAFDLESGAEIWSWDEEGPSYASPVRVTIEGVAQLVTHSRRHVVSVDVASGRLLWKIAFKTSHDQSSVTPISHGSKLIVSGLNGGILALEARPESQGAWLVETLWRNDSVPMHMSSPVVHDGLLFGLTNKRKGQLFCLDVETGEVQWTSAGREGDNASLIVAGDRLVVLTTEAVLTIGPANAEGWSPEASYEVADSATWAHPALVGDKILVKDKTHLTAWSFR